MKLKNLFLPVAGWVLVLAVLPRPILAWGNTWMGINLGQIIDATRGRAGALRYNAALLLDNAGYDSDIYFGYYESPVHDTTATAALNLRVFWPIKKKVVFDLSEIPQYTFYVRTHPERALNNAFRGQVHLALNRFYVQAGGSSAVLRDRLSPELDIRVRHREDTLFGLLLWQASKDTSFAVQYRRLSFRYADLAIGGENLRQTLSRDEDYVNVRAYLQQVARVRFYLDGEYGAYTFTEAVSRARNSRSYGAYGGVEFLPAPQGGVQTRGIQGRINIGYKLLDVLDPRGKDNSGLVGNSTIAVGFLRATALQAFFARDIQFSAYSGFAYYLQTTYGGGLAHFFSRRILFGYDLAIVRLNYPAPEEWVPEPPAFFRYSTHSVRLVFTMRRNLQLTLFSTLARRTAEHVAGSHHRYFFGLSLLYGYVSGENPLLVNPVSR